MISTIIEFIFLLMAHAAAGIYSSTLKYSKKTIYIIWGTWIVFQTTLLFFAEFVVKNIILQFLVSFVMVLIGQYTIFFATTKGRLAQRVFTMLTYSVFYCMIIAPFTMVKGTFGNLHPVLSVFVQALLLLGIVYYYLRHVCPLCRTAAKNITTGWSPLIMVNILFLFTVIFSSAFPVRLTSFRTPAAITYTFVCISIMLVYPVIFSNINSLSEAANKREVERQNKLLLTQIEAENAQLAVNSRARHDIRHHNLIMLELARNNDIESVKEYLKELVENEPDIWGETEYCDHITVNTVLCVYERRAKENGISVNISANVNRELDIPPQDLVIIIANLFENAIHASEKMKNRDKQINISIWENADRLLIKIENPCREKMVFDESLYGIGIHSVIAATDKYDGMYDFSAENGIFSAKISLNRNEQRSLPN